LEALANWSPVMVAGLVLVPLPPDTSLPRGGSQAPVVGSVAGSR
jgi:hypothetical protein